MTLRPTTLDEIDFWDLDMFTSGDPHAAWRLRREEAPVWYHDRPGGEPFWCVTRNADARAVHAEPMRFSSERDGIAVRSAAQLAAPPYGSGINPMIHTDPPRHAKLRKVVSHRFTPRSIAELEHRTVTSSDPEFHPRRGSPSERRGRGCRAARVLRRAGDAAGRGTRR